MWLNSIFLMCYLNDINIWLSSVTKRQGDEGVGKGQSKLEKGEEITPR
jgi:hypothetical protein